MVYRYSSYDEKLHKQVVHLHDPEVDSTALSAFESAPQIEKNFVTIKAWEEELSKRGIKMRMTEERYKNIANIKEWKKRTHGFCFKRINGFWCIGKQDNQ